MGLTGRPTRRTIPVCSRSRYGPGSGRQAHVGGYAQPRPGRVRRGHPPTPTAHGAPTDTPSGGHPGLASATSPSPVATTPGPSPTSQATTPSTPSTATTRRRLGSRRRIRPPPRIGPPAPPFEVVPIYLPNAQQRSLCGSRCPTPRAPARRRARVPRHRAHIDRDTFADQRAPVEHTGAGVSDVTTSATEGVRPPPRRPRPRPCAADAEPHRGAPSPSSQRPPGRRCRRVPRRRSLRPPGACTTTRCCPTQALLGDRVANGTVFMVAKPARAMCGTARPWRSCRSTRPAPCARLSFSSATQGYIGGRWRLPLRDAQRRPDLAHCQHQQLCRRLLGGERAQVARRDCAVLPWAHGKGLRLLFDGSTGNPVGPDDRNNGHDYTDLTMLSPTSAHGDPRRRQRRAHHETGMA